MVFWLGPSTAWLSPWTPMYGLRINRLKLQEYTPSSSTFGCLGAWRQRTHLQPGAGQSEEFLRDMSFRQDVLHEIMSWPLRKSSCEIHVRWAYQKSHVITCTPPNEVIMNCGFFLCGCPHNEGSAICGVDFGKLPKP